MSAVSPPGRARDPIRDVRHEGVPLSGPRVRIVSPSPSAANNGNWHTAARWQRFLASVAHVEIVGVDGDDGDDAEDAHAELLIALHARRSAAPIARWRERSADAPLVLVLTGTDLYRDLDVDAGARHSLECASRIVVLQEAALARLDAASRAKAVVIVQSASALHARRVPGDADLVAVGHLRDEKDPTTLYRAARLLAGDAVVPTIAHVGGPRSMRASPTKRERPWRPARPIAGSARSRTRRRGARSRGRVPSSTASRIEGGANVVVEAVRSGVPVLASRIDGNVGLLGADYDGYFPVGDAAALAALARRFLSDAAFADRLRAQCAAREPLFLPSAERRAVRALVAGLVPARTGAR